MLRRVRTFVRRLVLSVATVIFVSSVGLALYVYLGGEWSTVTAAIDRGRQYMPSFAHADGGFAGVRERVSEWIAPAPALLPEPDQSTQAIQVYFTPVHELRPDGPDDRLVSLIRSARKTVHAAFYKLDYDPVADALVDRHRAGVEVRLVSDSDYKDVDGVRVCISAGVPVEFDDEHSYMHNKFCVVDGEWVWTGSTNITQNGFFHNNNNAVLLHSQNAAKNFGIEFAEMFDARAFGSDSPRNTNRAPFALGESTVEVYFSPEDGVERQIRAEIAEAGEVIRFMAFAFTSKPIAEAMVDRMKWGVKVEGVLEARDTDSEYSRDDFLRARGATVHLDDNPKSMHHKVIIIDGTTVITGSYNFSNSAEHRNDENVLIIHSADVAGSFIAEFERLTAPSSGALHILGSN